MRNQNKYNFKVGDKVQLDKEYANTSEVIILHITQPSALFSRVVPAELDNPTDADAWETMTNRLTPIEK